MSSLLTLVSISGLLRLALKSTAVVLLAAVPMARRGALDDRVRGILDSHRNRAALSRAVVCLAAILAAAAMAPLAMLRAAPSEPAQSATAESTKEPPARPIVDLGRLEGQAEDAGNVPAPPTPAVKGIWNVGIEEALRTGLTNSKMLRNLGGLLFTPVAPQSDPNHAASQGTNNSAPDPNTIRGTKIRFVLARTNDDIKLANFKSGVRNLISDLERAYWDLYYHYRSLNAVQAGRDSALQTWRTVHALHMAGRKGREAEEEAQAREQYFLFRAQVENTLGLLYTAESRLRYLMGVVPSDGRVIRPTDEPTTAEVHFDWKEVLSQGLNRDVDLPQGNEPELEQVLTNDLRNVDRNYQVSRTTFNRRVAAAKQVEAVTATYEMGSATLDMLLDAQRRLADAEIAYHRAVVDYNIAILQIHFRKGSLLDYEGILLTEGTRNGSD